MAQPVRISDQITIGPQPEKDDFERLQAEGYRTVINLRLDNERDDQLRPMEEGDVVRGKGMEYLHIPVSMKQIREDQVDEFSHAVASLEGPFYVHCQSGKRAGLFALMHMACKQGWSGKQTLEEMKRRGIEVTDEAVQTFVRGYVDERTG